MRKCYFYLSLALAVLLVFACNFEIPSAVQIKGNPSLRFTANMDFSDIFSDITNEAFGSENNTTIQKCKNVPNVQTFLIRMEIINETFSIDQDLFTTSGGFITVPISQTVYSTKDSDTDAVELSFTNFGDILEGFKFSEEGIESKLFVNAPEGFNIELKFGTAGDITIVNFTNPKTSGINLSSDEYAGTALPPGGESIDIAKYLVKQEDMEIEIDIILRAGTHPAALLNSPVVVELVVWLPLVFEADGVVNVDGIAGAELKLPNLEGVGSFISEMPDMVKSLSLNIGLNQNPFTNGIIIVRSEELSIKNPLSGPSFNFAFSESDIKFITSPDNSFEPEFCIFMKNGSILEIPKEFRIMTISIEAKLDHTIDIGG